MATGTSPYDTQTEADQQQQTTSATPQPTVWQQNINAAKPYGAGQWGNQQGTVYAAQAGKQTLSDFMAGNANAVDAASALTNTGWYGGDTRNATNVAASGYLQKMFGLEDEENARFQQAAQFLNEQFQKNTQPTVTSDLINSMFARMSDSATSQHQQNMDAIRSYVGGSGVRGGVAADLAQQAELARLGSITGGLRDLGIFEMQQRAQDSIRNLESAFGLASFLNQSPSMLGADAFGTMLELGDQREGRQAMIQAANKAADASKSAGLQSLAGGVAGGLLGLLG